MLPTRVSIWSVALLVVGCAGSNQPSTEPMPAGGPAAASSSPRRDPDVITQSELEQSSLGDIDALTAVKRLRPQFLSFRGNVSTSDQSGAGTVQVLIDTGRLNSLDVLSSIRTSEIQEIRYLSAAAAAQRFGSLSKAGPVILVRRK